MAVSPGSIEFRLDKFGASVHQTSLQQQRSRVNTILPATSLETFSADRDDL
jgi:hypothetical protein